MKTCEWVGYEYELNIYFFEFHTRVYEHWYGIVTKRWRGKN